MLDQNTDRMWYVIGAVIVGAAIILIMNNAFPQLFASIGETFQGKTEEMTELTDGIGPFQQNALHDADWAQGSLNYTTGTLVPTLDRNDMNYYVAKYIPTNGATSVTLELKTTLPPMLDSSVNNAFASYDGTKAMNGFIVFRTYYYATNGSKGVEPVTYTKALPAGTEYIRIQLMYGNIGDYVLTFK